MNLERNLWMWMFIIALSVEYCSAQALQCYVCDDCGDPNDLTELQICGSIGTPIQVVTTRPPASVSTANASTELASSTESLVASTTSPSGLITSDASTSPASTTAVNTNNAAGSASSTGTNSAITTTATTSKASLSTTQTSATTEDEYEDYQEYDDNARALRPKQIVVPRLQESVCYILKWRKNGSIGTSRGCATMIDLNKTQACMSLYDGRPLEDCLICTTNGCNKREEEIPYDPWQENQINASAPVYSAGISAIVAALFTGLMLN